MRRVFLLFAAFALALTAALPAAAKGEPRERRVNEPLNLAVLVQDDLTARVGNELKITGDFIRALPAGSRVMVGYLTAGSLQVRQPFTDDLTLAAKALRIPRAQDTAAPYNPYVEVLEALKKFDAQNANRNAILLVSDGLDVSRGFDANSTLHSLDLERAIREARKRNVAVYAFYAPTVGLTSFNRVAINYGQGALNRLAQETGGRAFFQGSNFVTFDSYFDNLRRALNRELS